MNQSSTGAAIEEEKYLLTVVSLKNYGKATFDEAEHIRDTSLGVIIIQNHYHHTIQSKIQKLLLVKVDDCKLFLTMKNVAIYFNNEVQEEEGTNKITMDNSESNFWIDLGPSRWDFTAWTADQLDKMHRSKNIDLMIQFINASHSISVLCYCYCWD
ncbi:hypothetical protein T07_10738 [Trichinella nelsoni]|uniref:Uncharacterized protein n=1 Tax=Trichinella nelsoni TaxID=6336 RepID=A0A0V0RUS1_9BILA|nr:hypothetical protein T07_10738 [Trichinella nelsoni]